MKSIYNLSRLDDETLLDQLSQWIGSGRKNEAQVLAHIAEVDARRLYAQQAYSNMFAYCTDALRLSEAAAFRRLTAARASRRFPVLLEKVASGELHLCAIKLLAPHLNEKNCAHLVALATHTSKRTLERRLAALYPKAPVKDSIRKLPARPLPNAWSATPESPAAAPGAPRPEASSPTVTANPTAARPANSNTTAPGAASSQPRHCDTVEPLAADRYKIQFSASGALRDKIEHAQELLPVGSTDLASLFDRALDLLVDDLERKRYGVKRRRRASPKVDSSVPGPVAAEGSPRAGTGARRSRSRSIPRAVRRAVYDRDGGQCSFTRADGKRCSERRALELHHLRPFARGGGSSADNLTLRCRTHNLYAAELDFGSAVMANFRCREPAATYRSASRCPSSPQLPRPVPRRSPHLRRGSLRSGLVCWN